MEKLLLGELNIYELISYFSNELFYILGIILNVFLFVFFKRKYNSRRLSDLITSGTLILSMGILSIIYFKNNLIDFSILNNIFHINSNAILTNILINTFAFCFLITTYKLTRKANFKVPIINSILLLITFFSNLLIYSNNFLATFILLDIIIFLIYKYASNMRIRKDSIYSIGFCAISLCSSILFYSFYLINLTVKDIIQSNIIQVCICGTILLKIGVFPIFNYIATSKAKKDNIAYDILLFSYLPFIGILAFNKFIQFFDFTNEIFQISISVLLIFTFVSFALSAFRCNNLIKFSANLSYSYLSFEIICILLTIPQEIIQKLILLSVISIFALFSLLTIIKLNLKCDKIKIATLKTLANNNFALALLFTIILLSLINICPSGILKTNLEILKGIYLFDKMGIYIVTIAIICNIFIMFNTFKILQNIFDFNKKLVLNKLTKRTTSNYVVPVCVILILIIFIFI